MTVADVQRELNYAAAEGELRKIKGYWAKLSTLERSARKDERNVPKYREFLQRGIEKVNLLVSGRYSDDQAIAILLNWHLDYDKRRALNRIAELEEARGGKPMEAWMEVFAPAVWKAHVDAYLAFVATPDSVLFDRFQQSTEALFDAYEQYH